MTTRVVLLFFTFAGLACGRAPSPEARARDVGSWLGASGGVVTSWVGGSISSAAAESNLESTARTIGDVSREGLPGPLAERLGDAARAVERAREAVRAGDKAAATASAEEMARVSRQLSEG